MKLANVGIRCVVETLWKILILDKMQTGSDAAIVAVLVEFWNTKQNATSFWFHSRQFYKISQAWISWSSLFKVSHNAQVEALVNG